MIRRASPRDRPWRRPPGGWAKGRRLHREAYLAEVRRRIVGYLAETARPRRFAEIATRPDLREVRRPDLWASLRALADAGAIKTATALEGRTREGFRLGRVLPVFWHPRWSFPALERNDGGEGEGDHG